MREFGTVVWKSTNGELVIGPDAIEEAAARLEGRGFHCVRDDALIASLVIY